MENFIISTENTCDLDIAYLENRKISVVKLHYFLDGVECNDFDAENFYSLLSSGKKGTTSQPSPYQFEEAWRPVLESGKDVLHLSFASVLSGTYSCATTTAKRLQEEFPDRKIIVFDTKSEAAGQGLLVTLVADYRDKGYPIDECFKYAENMAPKINHVFTLDDLRNLVSTGRVTNAEAFIGNLLQIKPLLYTTEEGKLKPFMRLISRKLALSVLVDKAKAKYTGEVPLIYVSHSNCLKDAKYLESKLSSLGAKIEILKLSPVIGSHTGPNTVAIFLVGKDRNMRGQK